MDTEGWKILKKTLISPVTDEATRLISYLLRNNMNRFLKLNFTLPPKLFVSISISIWNHKTRYRYIFYLKNNLGRYYVYLKV